MIQTRTRFAPSPTGMLHIGGLRSALFCYAWAKKNKGNFVLRIEDTDPERLVKGAVEQIIRSLLWAGIVPDEGVVGFDTKPVQKGKHGPYIQSQRLDLYKKHAEKLLDEGKAYKCYCTPVRLEQMREMQRAAKQMPKYDRHCLHLSDKDKKELEDKKTASVIRFLVPKGRAVTWDDAVFGKMKFDREQVDDFVMIKTDGYATYNFANVVDDHLMEISHVIRGQEFLSSTAKHILVYKALGWAVPEFVHMPWILGKNKRKLSKREGDVSVGEYQDKGFLPGALLNYLALLGWNPKDDTEIFSMKEFISKFDLKDIQKSGAVFDVEKLTWMNGQYIRNLSIDKLYEAAMPYIKKAKLKGSEKEIKAMLATEQTRIKLFSEIPDQLAFYFEDKLKYDKKMLVWKPGKAGSGSAGKGKASDVPVVLQLVKDKFSSLKKWNEESIEQALREVVDESGKGVGDVFWPVRVALTGLDKSPGPHEVANVLGQEKAIARIDAAI